MTLPALKQSTAIIQQPLRNHHHNNNNNISQQQQQQQKRQRFSCWYIKMFNTINIMGLIMPIVLLLLLQLTAMSSYVNAQGEWVALKTNTCFLLEKHTITSWNWYFIVFFIKFFLYFYISKEYFSHWGFAVFNEKNYKRFYFCVKVFVLKFKEFFSKGVPYSCVNQLLAVKCLKVDIT